MYQTLEMVFPSKKSLSPITIRRLSHIDGVNVALATENGIVTVGKQEERCVWQRVVMKLEPTADTHSVEVRAKKLVRSYLPSCVSRDVTTQIRTT